MRDAALLRHPSDPHQQIPRILRGPVPPRRLAPHTLKQRQNQVAGTARV